MTMHQLVTLAGGPIAGADLRSAEVARMPADRSTGQLATIVRAPLDSSYLLDRDSLGRYAGPPGPAFPPAGSAAPFPLQPFDHVLILRQPEYQTPRLVSLTGKVTFPGAYAITSDDEHLSDLIRRAGGLLPSAYAAGTQFIRALDGTGRVNIDHPSALAHPDGEHDIVLQAGDSIHVPEYSPVVRVVGAVNSAVSVMYKPGADVDYYLDNAGGLMRNADEGRLSVRFADGSAEVTHRRALFWHWHPTPGPGSTVFVPSKPESEPLNTTQFLGNLAQILASSVAILVLATKF
jgi:protein involved in polysaccharide export with SLBB domain